MQGVNVLISNTVISILVLDLILNIDFASCFKPSSYEDIDIYSKDESDSSTIFALKSTVL